MQRLWVPVVAGFVLAAVAPMLVRRLPRLGPWLTVLYPAVALVGFASLVPAVVDGARPTWRLGWLPALEVDLVLRLDALALLFALLIMGIGTLVYVYATAYMREAEHSGRFYALLGGFTASMLGLVLAGDLLLLFVFWELTGLSSFLLIGFDGTTQARRAANQSLVVTTLGGLSLLTGLLLLWGLGGTTDVARLVDDPAVVRSAALFPLIVLTVAAGAFVKSAQVPLHFWLPRAMAAPTPVSAFLHSATMVKAGVYLLARLSPVLGANVIWDAMLLTAGTLSMVLGAWFALRERDMKRALASATISILGMLVLLLGVGTQAAVEAFVVLLIAHALYKAALFMVAGAVQHVTGTRDLLSLGGLRHRLPLLTVATVAAGLSLAGIVPFLTFVGKERMFAALLAAPRVAWLLFPAGVVASMLLVGVAFVFAMRPFFGKQVDAEATVAHAPPWALAVPPLVLGALGLAAGLGTAHLGPLVSRVSRAILPAAPEVHLALWHGFDAALWASVVSVGGGILLFLSWRTVLDRLGEPRPTGSGLYDRSYAALKHGAGLFTRRVQVGQLTVYLGVMGLAAALSALPLVWHTGGLHVPGRFDLGVSELGVAVLLAGAAVFVAWARAPLSAVVGVGLVGYAVAVVFVLYGALDLAMTQFVFETLFALLFLLVVPRLPTFRHVRSSRAGTAFRIGLPVLFGLAMGAFTLAAVQTPTDSAAAAHFVENALPLGQGRNVVNVVLVDFRAIDTLGEVTVLATAGLGVHALLTASGKGIPLAAQGRVGAIIGMERALVLRTLTSFLISLLVMYSLFLLLRGHNRPGGGFVGGLVATAAVGLHALAHDAHQTRQFLRFAPETFITLGLATVLASGSVGLLLGNGFLTSAWLPVTLPVLGGLKLGTPLLFDTGVYAIVLGVGALTLIHLEEEG